jgi:hypothetical protein
MRQASGYGAADAPANQRRSPRRSVPGVGEVIPVASLRPIRTAHKTLEDHTLERPSCGGFMPTAETTLIPAYSANQPADEMDETKIVDR